ncbi:exlusion protein FxsA [Halomonas sp. 1513]|nr:FxsA family protein [Halomonas sp. 1513]APX93402.1 exlusion protein FxsA [Halomonas sp. 1513]
MPFLLLFTLFALLDFVILFSVGSQIGLLTTLLLVLATGFIGLHLVRRQGVATLQRAQQRFAQGELPSGELITGAALIFGGALLMAPGFVSDALGFMCLIPGTRQLLGRAFGRVGVKARGFSFHHQPGPSPDDWHQAGRDAAGDDWQAQRGSQSGDAQGPIEGDFISRDDARR